VVITPRWPVASVGKPYSSRKDRGVKRGRPVREESRESGDGEDFA
jgi:hypothetical protein